MVPHKVADMDLHEDAMQKLNRRGTLHFVKNVLIQRMKMGASLSHSDSNSQASRFNRNLAGLAGSRGLGVLDGDLNRNNGDLENGGRDGFLDAFGDKKKTGLERGRLDKTGGLIMIAHE
jgi:hypothetical protein